MISKSAIYSNVLSTKLGRKTTSNILFLDNKFIETFDKSFNNTINIQFMKISDFLKKLNTNKYNIIILYNIFSEYDNDKIKEIFDIIKNVLIDDGKIILINNLITKINIYKFHPFSYVNFLFFGKAVYIHNMIEEIRSNDFYILDCDRIYTYDLITYPIEYFSMVCRLR